MTEKVKSIVAELRRRFDGLYGDRLVQMVLYGSQARGDAEPGSDIDVLVVLEGPVACGEEIDRTLDDVAELSLDNDVVICCVFMDEHRFTTRHGPLLRNVRKEGVPI